MDRWQQINQLFHSALAYEGGQRAAFLARACADDEALRAEVESLVAAHEQAASFIETPAADVAADLFAGGQTRLAVGQKIGHYTIIALLGAGGMGAVYLAQDKKLDRQVAVKILNEKLIQREAKLPSFIREAKAASALNHPNILTIYEIGESADAQFIVSEFIEGKTLRELVRAARLSVSELLDIAIQIGGALAAAHQAHLIHRDIKPENVMIRPDGYVKILDFGLAKLLQSKQTTFGLDTAAQQNETANGLIMGTVNYMSPEQAKGERVDERTDIFSLGVVLYEMLAGRTPFAGNSRSETFANLINQEPQPLARFAANVPAELQRIVAKLLRKNKDERYQTMQAVLLDLKGLRENLSAAEKSKRAAALEDDNATALLPATTGKVNKQTAQTQSSLAQTIERYKSLAAFALVGLLVLATALSLSLYRFAKSKNTSGEPFRHIRLSRLTNIGNVGNFALSPDGNLIAYETKEKEGVSIWVRQIEMSNSVNLVPLKKGNITFLTFSPDGKFVYYGFFSGYDSTEALYSVPALGGASRRVPNITTNFMSFAPDGKHYAQVTSNMAAGEKALVINALDSNEETRLAVRRAPRSFNILGQFCAWSPDGKTIAVISNETDADGHFSTLVGVSTADGAEKPLSAQRWNELNSVQWLKDGSGLLVLGSDTQQARSQIWLISADGAARMLTNDLNDYSYLGVTADGKQIVAVQESRTSSIWFGPFGQSANDFQELISETGALDTIVLPADDQIIFRSHADGKPNLWTIGTDGGGRRQLTVDAEVDGRGLCAAPAAKLIVFPARKAGKVNLWRVNVAGGDAEQLTFGDGEFFPVCLPDERGVVYQKGSGYGIKSTLWSISLAGGQPLQLTDYYAIRPALSPDGRHIAFFYLTKGKWRIGIISAAGGAIEQNFEVPEGVLDRILRWSPDGQALFYIANEGNVGNVWSLPLNGQLPKQVTKFNAQLLADFVLTQHGQRAVVTRTIKLRDIVTISEE
jgi:serine/threonine protein kinase